MKEKFFSCYDFFQIEDIFNGLIKIKDNIFVKIIEVEPINLSLKSDFEKEIILNSYKNFLKGLNSNIQILIQSKTADLNDHLEKIKLKDNSNLSELISSYYSYIQTIQIKSLYSKKFYISVCLKNSNNQTLEQINKKLLNETLKIVQAIEKCGNKCKFIEERELKKVLYSFVNLRLSREIGGEF